MVECEQFLVFLNILDGEYIEFLQHFNLFYNWFIHFSRVCILTARQLPFLKLSVYCSNHFRKKYIEFLKV